MIGSAKPTIASAVIASAAKQSIAQQNKYGLLRRGLLAMTVVQSTYGFAFPRRNAPELCTRQNKNLELPNNFFGSRFGVRLGGGIVRRHEAGRGPAPDETAGLLIRGYGRTPMSRPAFVSHNRKLRYLGHIASIQDPAPTAPRCQRLSLVVWLAGLAIGLQYSARRDLVGGVRLLYPDAAGGASMTPFAKVFSTRTLLQIVAVLTATIAMKALSLHYDFSWAAALTAG
jgi:hypothetical protein